MDKQNANLISRLEQPRPAVSNVIRHAKGLLLNHEKQRHLLPAHTVIQNVTDGITLKREGKEGLVFEPCKRISKQPNSNEDREFQRKLRNRVAAERGRMRKREYVETLENKVKTLEEEKLTLQQAKQFIDNKCYGLERENLRLREELTQITKNVSCQAKFEAGDNWIVSAYEDVETDNFGGSESAALLASPQQGHLFQASFLVLMMLLSINFLTASGGSLRLEANMGMAKKTKNAVSTQSMINHSLRKQKLPMKCYGKLIALKQNQYIDPP